MIEFQVFTPFESGLKRCECSGRALACLCCPSGCAKVLSLRYHSVDGSRLTCFRSFTYSSGWTSILLGRMTLLCELTHSPGEYESLLHLLSDSHFETQERQRWVFYFCQCPNQECAAFSWSDSRFFKITLRAHIQREKGSWIICVCL